MSEQIEFSVYFWIHADTSDFPEVTMIPDQDSPNTPSQNGTLLISEEAIGAFIARHPKHYIAFRMENSCGAYDPYIFIDTKLFKQR
jgi:hypothetical protein